MTSPEPTSSPMPLLHPDSPPPHDRHREEQAADPSSLNSRVNANPAIQRWLSGRAPHGSPSPVSHQLPLSPPRGDDSPNTSRSPSPQNEGLGLGLRATRTPPRQIPTPYPPDDGHAPSGSYENQAQQVQAIVSHTRATVQPPVCQVTHPAQALENPVSYWMPPPNDPMNTSHNSTYASQNQMHASHYPTHASHYPTHASHYSTHASQYPIRSSNNSTYASHHPTYTLHTRTHAPYNSAPTSQYQASSRMHRSGQHILILTRPTATDAKAVVPDEPSTFTDEAHTERTITNLTPWPKRKEEG